MQSPHWVCLFVVFFGGEGGGVDIRFQAIWATKTIFFRERRKSKSMFK